MTANRLRAFVISCTLVELLNGQQALGASNFVQTYLDAQGGCQSGSALSFVLAGSGRQSPFGRSAADWTDDDLNSLKRTLASCIQAAEARNNTYLVEETRRDVDRIAATIPQIVKGARAQRDAQVRQLQARKELAQSRLEKATRDREQARASADAEVGRLEHEATLAKADARAAAAVANRQIDEATHRSADAKAKIAESLAALRPVPSTPGEPHDAGPPGELRELQDDLTSAVTKTNFVACRATAQLVEASKGIVTNDMDLVARLVKSGECVVVDRGTSVRMRSTDANAGHGVVCVGIDGHPDCLWVPRNNLQASR